jgi:hypothetical protein
VGVFAASCGWQVRAEALRDEKVTRAATMGSSKAVLKREVEEAAAAAMAAALAARFAGAESRAEAIKGDKTAKVDSRFQNSAAQETKFFSGR